MATKRRYTKINSTNNNQRGYVFEHEKSLKRPRSEEEANLQRIGERCQEKKMRTNAVDIEEQKNKYFIIRNDVDEGIIALSYEVCYSEFFTVRDVNSRPLFDAIYYSKEKVPTVMNVYSSVNLELNMLNEDGGDVVFKKVVVRELKEVYYNLIPINYGKHWQMAIVCGLAKTDNFLCHIPCKILSGKGTQKIEWMPSTSFIEGVDNYIFLYHIYCRLSHRERAVLSCVNKDWAELYKELHRNGNRRLAKFVIGGRILHCFPRVPSLMAFQLYGSEPFAHQFFFDGNNKYSTGQRQVISRALRDLSKNRTYRVRRTPYSFPSRGTMVIASDYSVLDGLQVRVGQLDECTGSWRWIRTQPPSPAGIYFDVIIVGRFAVNFHSVCRTGGRTLEGGCYYDLDSSQWSKLTALMLPQRVNVPPTAHFVVSAAFSWNNQLFVSGDYETSADCPLYAQVCTYNFETQSWNPWNGTPELLRISKALMKLCEWSTKRGFFILKNGLVEATDRTLFVVCYTQCGRNTVYFLNLDENTEGCFEWNNVALPQVDGVDEVHYHTKAWPLEALGSIVIVSQLNFGSGDLVWWFLNRHGVYAKGAFHRNSVLETRYALIHTDM